MPQGLGKPQGDADNDDYVARVLAEEARNSSLKYSTDGMGAYMPKRPTGAAPKPNTRFLRHIIKETDSHNAALKKKEEREARERMRQLRSQPSTSLRSSGKEHHNRRHHRSDGRDPRQERRGDRDDRYRSHRRRHRTRSPSAERDRSHKSRGERKSDYDRLQKSRGSHHRRSTSRSRSRSHHHEREPNSPSRRRHYRRRSSSPPTSRSRSPDSRKRRNDKESIRKRRRPSPVPSPLPQSQLLGDESDPLEDLVGPLPPKEHELIRFRGRGAYRPHASNIDAHFAPDYDPTLDVQPEDEGLETNKPTRRAVPGLMTGDDDWELALEAVRDRARWKQKGEERLREAGFNNDVVERWKTSASPMTTGDWEGRLNDVKWSSKSEGREWDRGKYVDADGHIDVKASWSG